MRDAARWFAAAAAVIALDQLAKFLVARSFTAGETLEIAPFFNLVLVYNAGAAFSFLSDAAGWQRYLFIAIAAAASIWIVYLLVRYPRHRLFCAALSLVLGGALGNVIDRLAVGAVIDFLDFHALGYHWPAFNLADSAISTGAALLILDGLLYSKKSESAGKAKT